MNWKIKLENYLTQKFLRKALCNTKVLHNQIAVVHTSALTRARFSKLPSNSKYILYQVSCQVQLTYIPIKFKVIGKQCLK